MTTQKIVIHIPAAPPVALSSEEKAVEINETNRKFDVVAPVENPVLHESDLVTLKQIALFTAQKIAEKATSTDEIHQCTAALEQELARINRLNGMKAEVEYRNINLVQRKEFEHWLKQQKKTHQ